jgi:4-hydroxybenzoate polyprenyltransferase/phosphoserine phosphatase
MPTQPKLSEVLDTGETTQIGISVWETDRFRGKCQFYDNNTSVPLCIDLDGTLVRTDTLVESIVSLLKNNLLYLFMLPIWLLKGKSHLKQQVADRVELDVELLPYNEAVLAYLKHQSELGRRLILVTGANIKVAQRVAQYLQLFDGVLASDISNNCSGRSKQRRLLQALRHGQFAYMGNAWVDLEVWSDAKEALLVNPPPRMKEAVERVTQVTQVFEGPNRGDVFKQLLRLMRLHHWVKNLLVFVPLIVSHEIHNLWLVVLGIIAFLAFGLCASSVYLLNDVLDLTADRRHPTKRHRPLAAGTIPIVYGLAVVPGLLAASFGLALALPADFRLALIFYYGATLAYSFRLKSVALLDVISLAGLYTIRVLAGAAAMAIPVSFWLLAFSMFLFLSLALVKRYTELLMLEGRDMKGMWGRGYQAVDLETLSQSGTSSGFIAVLILALYINSQNVRELYSNTELLWTLCPLFLYWINRIWLVARRDKLHEDPVVFTLHDKQSYWVGLLVVLITWLAI